MKLRRLSLYMSLLTLGIDPLESSYEFGFLVVRSEESVRSLFGIHYTKDMIMVVDLFFIHLVYRA